MKKLSIYAALTTIVLTFFSLPAMAQIQQYVEYDSSVYIVIKKYDDHSLKRIGQFGKKRNRIVKHGVFIKFDRQGNVLSKKYYFYNHRRNKTFLGFKMGWWGSYGQNTKYFFNKPVKHAIVDPGF